MSVSSPVAATMLASENMLGLPFPVFFEGDCFTPWDENLEEDPILSSFLQIPHHQSQNPVNSDSSLDEPESRPPVSVAVDERKQRRMISNRESARRSRMRKQKHIEDLRNQVHRLTIENRDIGNRLALVTHHYHLIRRDNDRLRSESVALRQRLSDVRRVLMLQRLQQQHFLLSSSSSCNSFSYFNEVNNEQPPSLIA